MVIVIARSTVTKQSGKRLPRFARNDEEGLAVTGNGNRHCEERSDEAIWEEIATPAWGGLAMTKKGLQ